MSLSRPPIFEIRERKPESSKLSLPGVSPSRPPSPPVRAPHGHHQGVHHRLANPTPSATRGTELPFAVEGRSKFRFSPDQTGNPLRPKASPWVGSGA
ncbi:hypothetical protein GQ457_17G010690 [Hibiscus cannabinus]